MKKQKLSMVALALGSLFVATNAHAWPKCPDGSVSLLNEAGKYVCPSPTQGGQPVEVTATGTGTGTATSDADAKAAADAIAAALANGGSATATGGNASAISDNWNKLSAAQQQAFMASLSQQQRAALTATLNNQNSAQGGAGGAAAITGSGNGGGATLTGNSPTATAAGSSGNQTNLTTNNTNTYRQVTVQPLFMPTPPSVSTTSQIVTERTACGPLMTVTKKGVKGTHIGFFTNTQIDLGDDMEIGPVYKTVKGADGKAVVTDEQVFYQERTFDESGRKVVRRFGAQSIITTALPSVSAASSMSIGGAGPSGGGNVGGGSSSAMTRIVTKVQIVPCELPGSYALELIPPPPPAVPPVSKAEVDAALAALAGMKWSVDVPTDRVERRRVQCTMEEFTDAKGVKVKMCRGPQGSYEVTDVTRDRVRAQGSLTQDGKAGTSGK